MIPLSLALLLTGCGADEPATEGPTWADDVQPIFAARCQGCHTAGGVAPFGLDSYTEAAQWAQASAAAVEARTMPPWLVTDDGTCGDWADSDWLSDEELATVRAWADAGAPQGDGEGSAVPEPAAELDGSFSEVQSPDFLPEIVGGEYAEFDEYRCFRVGEVDEDTFLTGYEVLPGNDAIVHHVLLMPVDPSMSSSGGRTVGEVMDESDGADGRPGWPCFGGAGQGIYELAIPVTWAPGQGAVNYPADSGVKLHAGHELVMQVHYNLVDEATWGQTDQTTVRLETTDTVEREAFFALPDAFLDTLGRPMPATIPAGTEAWSYDWEMSSMDLLGWYWGDYDGIVGAELYGVMPHMHQYGTQMTVEVDGACAAEVRQWDFNWQRLYFYETPVPLTGQETIRVECTWSTEGTDRDITPGWGTYNEMCLPVMYVVLDRE